MATFNASAAAADMRLLFAWRQGLAIDNIAGSTTNILTVTDFDPEPPVGPPDLVLTYTGTDPMTANLLVPLSGTFQSISISYQVSLGTLTGITRPDNFSEIDDDNAYHILDGDDVLNGSVVGGDVLFGGYGGKDEFHGLGGGDTFVVSAIAGMLAHKIFGTSGATDTLAVVTNFYTGANGLDLRSATLQSINAVSLEAGIVLVINGTQLGAGISSTATIAATSGTALFDVNFNTPVDASALNVNPNVTMRFFGNQLDNTLTATNAADQIYGREGADTLNGLGGNDIFQVTLTDGEFDTINGGSGTDTVKAYGSDPLTLNGFNATTSSIENWDSSTTGGVNGNAGANTFDFRGLTGVEGVLVVKGAGGADSLYGSGFDDSLGGGEGNDLLSGENGADFLTGDAGKDTMTGGAGADNFFYWATTDSRGGKALRDVITDFQAGVDKIDVGFIDPDSAKPNDQKFKFTKKEGAAFKGKVGQIVFDQIDKAGKAKDMTVIYADTNGDQTADMAIQLKGLVDLQKTDFFL